MLPTYLSNKKNPIAITKIIMRITVIILLFFILFYFVAPGTSFKGIVSSHFPYRWKHTSCTYQNAYCRLLFDIKFQFKHLAGPLQFKLIACKKKGFSYCKRSLFHERQLMGLCFIFYTQFANDVFHQAPAGKCAL